MEVELCYTNGENIGEGLCMMAGRAGYVGNNGQECVCVLWTIPTDCPVGNCPAVLERRSAC